MTSKSDIITNLKREIELLEAQKDDIEEEIAAKWAHITNLTHEWINECYFADIDVIQYTQYHETYNSAINALALNIQVIQDNDKGGIAIRLFKNFYYLKRPIEKRSCFVYVIRNPGFIEAAV